MDDDLFLVILFAGCLIEDCFFSSRQIRKTRLSFTFHRTSVLVRRSIHAIAHVRCSSWIALTVWQVRCSPSSVDYRMFHPTIVSRPANIQYLAHGLKQDKVFLHVFLDCFISVPILLLCQSLLLIPFTFLTGQSPSVGILPFLPTAQFQFFASSSGVRLSWFAFAVTTTHLRVPASPTSRNA